MLFINFLMKKKFFQSDFFNQNQLRRKMYWCVYKTKKEKIFSSVISNLLASLYELFQIYATLWVLYYYKLWTYHIGVIIILFLIYYYLLILVVQNWTYTCTAMFQVWEWVITRSKNDHALSFMNTQHRTKG